MKISFIKETFEVKIGGVIKPNLKKNCNTKKFIKAILCNLSMRMLKYIFFKFKFFFAHKKLKKPPSKVAQNSSNPLFFITALTAQTAQTEEFLFQNVAY